MNQSHHEQPDEQMERYLRDTAGAFHYPPTPDVAGAVRQRLAQGTGARSRGRQSQRRLAWAAVVLLLGLVSSLFVPQVQAFVRSIFRIGAIEIVVATATPGASSVTPSPLWDPRLRGQTTLADAQKEVSFPIKLPSYPPDLGRPNRVFVQDEAGPLVILGWVEASQPDQPRIVLYEMSTNTAQNVIKKTRVQTNVIQATRVHGREALWVRGPHILEFSDGRGTDLARLVEGDVLIWEEGPVTYRLESKLTLEEAVKVAESLTQVPELAGLMATPLPLAMTPVPVAGLAGEKTLVEAQAEVLYKVHLPTYPREIGEPDRVFVQYLGSPIIILAWLQPGDETRARMVLYQMTYDVVGEKSVSSIEMVQETMVNGNRAAWVRGPHFLSFKDRSGETNMEERRLVDGNVLVWEEGGVTYRLESALTLEEAVRVAESLR